MSTRHCGFLLACVLATLAVPAPAAAQQEPITKEQADAILKELSEIKQLLRQLVQINQARATPAAAPAPAPARALAPPARAKVRAAEGYRLGRDDAPLTLIEYTDYECPFCRRFHVETFPQLVKDYVDTGKVRFISRDLPLSFHANAMQAAHAARCAGEQGKFWEMRDVLSNNAKDLAQPSIVKYAVQVGLQAEAFSACHESNKYKPEIQKDIAEANAAGLTGTPSFVLGKTSENFEGIKIVGAKPYAAFEASIKELLAPPKMPDAPASAPRNP